MQSWGSVEMLRVPSEGGYSGLRTKLPALEQPEEVNIHGEEKRPWLF